VTPAHDPVDFELGLRHGLEQRVVLDRAGAVNELGGPRYQGLDRFTCRERIWEDLGSAGLAMERRPHLQRVPRSQRGGEVIEPLLSLQWFVKTEHMAFRAAEAVSQGHMR